MKKPEIAKSLARRAGLTEAEAADHLDQVVHGILSSLRKGKQARLPGLGTFTQNRTGQLTFKRITEKKRG